MHMSWLSKVVGLVVILAVVLTGCKGEEKVEEPSASITRVTLTPFQAAVKPGESITLLAKVIGTGTFSSEVDWTVDASGGTLVPQPPNPQEPVGSIARFTASDVSLLTSVKVRAASRTNPSLFAEAFLLVPPKVPPDLLITEVSATYYYNQPAWVELFNGTPRSLELGAYALRTKAINPANGTEQEVLTFPLPSVVIPPGGYIVVAGRTSTDGSQLSSQELVFVAHESAFVPWWYHDGFVELVQTTTGQTVDFVRFGKSERAPTTPGLWRNTNIQALPIERAISGSLVRAPDTSDLNDATGWALSPFATPGGPNDVPANATDGDGDGIPDSAEVEGGRFAGMDLHAMGARTQQKDLFIEVDHMDSTDPGLIPAKEALDKLVSVFAAHSIHIHVDAGTKFSATFAPSLYNLGQGNPLVPYAKNIAMGAKSGFASNFYAYKAAHMRLARSPLFHYCLFASSVTPDGSASNGGMGEMPGNDFMLTFSGWQLSTATAEARNMRVNYQASTLMHELGHNLGLDHGGNVSTNYKPNYVSVMNYLHAVNGLGPLHGSSAGDRYYLQWNLAGYTYASQLTNSPLTTAFVMDFSDGSGAAIDENAVDEARGLARPGATFVDYDANKAQGVISIDLNRDGKKEVFQDYNDWANLTLPFQVGTASVGGPGLTGWEPPRASFVDDVQPVAHEEPPPPAFFNALRATLSTP
jgi:hypothetical protein